MIEFIDDLDLKVLSDESFMVMEDFMAKYYDQYIIVPKGFVTDLASVPRVPIAYLVTANKGTKPAVLHDYLYSKDAALDLPREVCDAIFLCGLEAEGIGFFTRQAMYRAVRMFGGSHYK